MQLKHSCKKQGDEYSMSQQDKLLQRMLTIPKDFTYSEAKKLLGRFRFKERNKGKTSGSRVSFYRESDKKVIMLHKPHPGDILKSPYIREIIEYLQEIGEIDE